jgi:hypothetical protein
MSAGDREEEQVIPAQYLQVNMPASADLPRDRASERRRAVALARHFREAEGLSIVQIADRLGRSPGTVKAYFYDPTGEKARAVKARYQGVCRGCGAYTQPRNGKGDAYAYCKACHPGAIERRWTRQRVLDVMHVWRARYGRLPSSYARTRTGAAAMRSSASATGTGRPRASSRTSTEAGLRPARSRTTAHRYASLRRSAAATVPCRPDPSPAGHAHPVVAGILRAWPCTSTT